MRKLFSFNMVTLDGYFEGSNHEIDWHNVDGEFNEFAIEQTGAVDMLLFGRVTYQLMASYWPTPSAIANDPIVADLMNRLPKPETETAARQGPCSIRQRQLDVHADAVGLDR